MKLVMILLFLTFLVSCESLEQKLVCKQIPSFEIVTVCNVSFKYEKCTCWDFDYMEQKVVSDGVSMPLTECPDDIIGYLPQDFSKELKPKIKKLSRLHNNLCQ